MSIAALATLTTVLFLGADDANKKPDGKPDPAKAAEEALKKEWSVLNGKWLLVKIEEENGVQEIPEGTGYVVYDNEKYRFRLGVGAQMVREEGTMKFMPGKKPKQIDVKITGGPDAGKMQYGIYEIDGDTFKFCVAKAGQDEKQRPTALKRKSGTEELLFTFKREKKPGTKI